MKKGPIDWTKFADSYEIGIGSFGAGEDAETAYRAVTIRVVSDNREIFLTLLEDMAKTFVEEFREACKQAWPEGRDVVKH